MHYAIYHATRSDLADFLSLQQDVSNRVALSEHFAPDDGEYFCKVVSGKGYVLLMRDNETLIACCMLNFVDADDEDNLGFDLDFSEVQRRHVAHLETIFVRHGYQGKGIATHLLDTALSLALAQDRYEILATVHPDNAASLRIFLSRSFIVSGFAHKYGNLPRSILRYQPNARKQT